METIGQTWRGGNPKYKPPTHLKICENGCLGLRDVKVNVPIAVVRGKNAELKCSYDLEGETLYSVKWYRGGNEFFRYTPKDKEQIKLFLVSGIDVRLNESTDSKIVLENVSRDISGPFSCEVTAELPSFFTDMQTAELQVVDIPRNNPQISGFKKRYALEEEFFHANCTSGDSYPAANITWYINGLPKKGPQIFKRTLNHGKLLTVTSMIRHRLEKKLFIKNRMKLRCAASIYNVYHQSTEVSIQLIKKRKHQRPDWPPSTVAPTLLLDDVDYNEDQYDDLSVEPPETTLWFWSPSDASSNLLSVRVWSTLLVIIIAFTLIR